MKNNIKIKNYKIDNSLINKYSNLKYYIKTYGCQMNEHDSENISAILNMLGMNVVDDYYDADLVILNTCSIRENAHNKAFGMLGRLKNLKKTKKDLIIGIAGCMSQEKNVLEHIKKDYKFVNFVIGTHNLYDLALTIDNSLKTKKQEIDVLDCEELMVEDIPVKRSNNYKAYVNIIYGCNKFCTYCIVPYTRGRERSRKYEDILKEVDQLISDGYKEITFLGQNVNAYGKDLYDDYNLANLLEDTAKKNIKRIRFMTSHPWNFTNDMIDVIAKYDNIMPSIHLPVQSGSNKILKLMGRRYTKEEYLKLFKNIKDKVKNVTISTDIIVGFPNETDEDFNETLDLVNKCKFDNAFTFIYSKRDNTPAAKIKDNISLKCKEERLDKLNNLVNTYFLESNKLLLNKEVEVMVEGISTKKNMYYGYNKNNKLVNFTSSKLLNPGDIVNVLITDAKTWSLDGKYE